jgi:hypothetical protein
LLVFFTNKPKCLTTMQSMYGLGKTQGCLSCGFCLNAGQTGLVVEKHKQGRATKLKVFTALRVRGRRGYRPRWGPAKAVAYAWSSKSKAPDPGFYQPGERPNAFTKTRFNFKIPALSPSPTHPTPPSPAHSLSPTPHSPACFGSPAGQGEAYLRFAPAYKNNQHSIS